MSLIKEFISDNGLCLVKGKVCSETGRPLGVNSQYDKYMKFIKGGDKGMMTLSTFREKLEDFAPDQTKPEQQEVVHEFETVDTEQQVVEQAIKYYGIKISPTGESMEKGQHSINGTSLDSLISEYVITYNNQSQFFVLGDAGGKMVKSRRTFNLSDIKKVLESYIVQRDLRNRDDLKDLIAFDPEYEEFADKKLKRILERFRPPGDGGVPTWDRDFHVKMIKQWMWQVKQNIFPLYEDGKRVPTIQDHYLINFSSDSGEGAGKTTFVRKLCAPLKDYFHEGTLENVTSSADFGIFASNYVVLFDELSFGKIPAAERGKAMTALKYMLTSENVFNRIFHTQRFQKMRRQFSGISTSNGSLTTMIYDPTGMRRFYEISVNPNRDVKRYQIINNTDFTDVWKGIDENNRKGVIVTDSEDFNKLQSLQKGYIKKDAIDIYIDHEDDVGLMKVDNEKTKLLIDEADKHKSETTQELEDTLKVTFKNLKEFREEILMFYRDDKDEQRWIPKRDALKEALRNKGYWVLRHKGTFLIPTGG